MASYIEITDEETDPGAPVTSELLKKERDNPIAIAEGASGAPRIEFAAMAHGGALGAVGTYAFLSMFAFTGISAGSTYAGSALRYHGVRVGTAEGSYVTTPTTGAAPSGTWRAMGSADTPPSGARPATIFIRIA